MNWIRSRSKCELEIWRIWEPEYTLLLSQNGEYKVVIWTAQVVADIIILRHIYKYGNKIMWLRFFTRYLRIAFTAVKRCSFKFLNTNFFFSKFVVEWDWNGSQNVQNFVCFWNISFFRKKPWFSLKSSNVEIFCRVHIKWFYFLKMILWGFLANDQNIFKVVKIRKWWRKSILKEKTLLSFKTASSSKWEGSKDAGWRRPPWFLNPLNWNWRTNAS